MFEEVALRTIAETMTTEYPVLDKDYSLAAALDEMEKYKTDRIILTEKGEIRGILTLRDVIFKLGTVRTKQTTPSALHASSFMSTPVFTLEKNETLLRAAKEMTSRGITSIPVVEDGKPVGLLSRWELARLISEAKASSDISVRTVMKTPPVSVGLQTKILHARQLIHQHDLSVIPVVEDGRFVGVIGVDEIALIFIKYYELSRGEPKRITPLKYLVVADAIKLRPPSVDPDAPLSEAASKMLEHRYRAVVVLDNERPVGVITGLELARVLTI